MKEFAQYYQTLLMLIVLAMTINRFQVLTRDEGYCVIRRKENVNTMLLFLFFFVLLFGFRPLALCFGDTINYAHVYNDIQIYNNRGESFHVDNGDWFFNLLMISCAQVMDVHLFFFIIILLYIMPMYWGCEKLDRNHVLTMMLFCVGSFIFYACAVNGIRNGMACSIVILALACLCRGQLLWPIVLSFIAIGCHKSMALPVACMFFAKYVKKNNLMFCSWIGAVLISLSFGNHISSLISSISYDPRFSQNFEVDSGGVADLDGIIFETRFRWDFLLYSSMPILLGWYAIFKRKVYNNTYLILLGTYIYANAFWVLAIRAIFSNRIANLSWFLYPIVLAYPLLNLPVFKIKHSRKTAWILLAHFGFTFVMFLLGKA